MDKLTVTRIDMGTLNRVPLKAVRHEKTHFMVVLLKSAPENVIVRAEWWNTGSASHCLVRCVAEKRPLVLLGYAYVTGCGFHRESAALADALANAGFTFNYDFGGMGEKACREALLAVARHKLFAGRRKVVLLDLE